MRILENPWFDRIVIVVIAINSCFLALNDYTWKSDDGTDKPLGNVLLDNSELFFTIFFTSEFVIKIISMGIIFADNCYFKDGWNVLDFMVVTTAIISTIPGYTNFASLRMFRLIRPLRTLSIYPSMKLLTNTLFSSIS